MMNWLTGAAAAEKAAAEKAAAEKAAADKAAAENALKVANRKQQASEFKIEQLEYKSKQYPTEDTVKQSEQPKKKFGYKALPKTKLEATKTSDDQNAAKKSEAFRIFGNRMFQDNVPKKPVAITEAVKPKNVHAYHNNRTVQPDVEKLIQAKKERESFFKRKQEQQQAAAAEVSSTNSFKS